MLEQREQGKKISEEDSLARKPDGKGNIDQPDSKGQAKPRRARTSRIRRRKPVRAADQGLPGQTTLDPLLYINRELSWLEFNQRVFEEAQDKRHPLLERAKFLAITSSNLDEFFMIRVAAIKEQILADFAELSPDGKVPVQQLKAIHERSSRMFKEKSGLFWNELQPQFAENGIHLLKMNDITTTEKALLSEYYAREIFPVLTPLAFDPGHPFPYISNLSLNLAVSVSNPKGEERFARVKVPDVLPRLVEIPGGAAPPHRFVWLEDLIRENLGMLFPGMTVNESHAFHVTRNADIEIQEDEAEDLIHSIEESIKMRRFGSVVRLKVEDTMPQRIIDILAENLEITQDDVYHLKPPLGFGHLMQLLKLPRPDLKDAPHHPALLLNEEEGDDIFALIRRGDVVLHHPYDSFAPVVQFIRSAATDPNVLAIKQTLYRIGKESPLIPLLILAAESGKQVAVLVELKARFDEENNIGWAKKLERAGIHVVYGLVGLKTHSKIALVIRKEPDGLRRYVHLGTGNYNPDTARIYTDISYLTCKEDFAIDASEVFNFLTGFSHKEEFKKLIVAPVNLRSRITELIQREIGHARNGKPAQVVMKMNALTDTRMIETLYEASKAGVLIDIIVRGICCLRPGVKGVSENIRVRSIVGRFLEHSRVFYFSNNGHPELYCSSADLMGRNLDRRVELMFPIEDRVWAEFIKRETLDDALCDTAGTRVLDANGNYTRVLPTNGEPAFDVQSHLLFSRSKQLPRKAMPRESPLGERTEPALDV
ncbi:MAG: polyphosphate kinase 1 [Bacteroidetes bacterium]|nr:polyphosphate kinase 1 [Bacteroidota bacterium]MCW5896897.1 polyphosphate kinase 1 [Bacteroidota bacterium]